MGILYLTPALFFRHLLRHIGAAVFCLNICRRRLSCFLRYSGGIGTQVGDNTHRAVAFDIYAFIELLGNAHGLLGREIQHLARLLLERRCGKGHRRLLCALSRFFIRDPPVRAFAFFQNLLQFLLISDNCLFIAMSVIPGSQRLFLSLHLQHRIQCPVFFRHKSIDLLFPLADNPKGGRLYSPRREPPFYFCPEHRRNTVAHHPVQHPSHLLGVHQIHINLPGIFQRLFHRALCNLIKGDAVYLLPLQLQRVIQMPGDRFALPVRIRCQIDLLGFFYFFSESGENIALSPDRNIFQFKIIFRRKAKLTLWQITNMSVARHHLIVCPQKFFDRFHLCGRFHNYQIFCHDARLLFLFCGRPEASADFFVCLYINRQPLYTFLFYVARAF